MTLQLLPPDFESRLHEAVRCFWKSRSQGNQAQEGGRGSVISGKNLDGFLEVILSISNHCGLPDSCIFLNGRHELTIPGYYRASKNWDVLIIHKCCLVAALEFKFQVGSFGNNFNNRAEEAIGNAADFRIASQKGAYQPCRHRDFSNQIQDISADPRPPFLGFLMLLEDCAASNHPVEASSPHYEVFSEFKNASYSNRYKILCERLMEQRLYDAAALAMSDPISGASDGAFRCLSDATSVQNLFTQLAGRILAEMNG